MEESRGRLVGPDQAFWLEEGIGLRTLGELLVALALLSPKSYELYVSEGKNNFADWVEFCMENKELGDSLRLLKEQDEMCAEVRSYV